MLATSAALAEDRCASLTETSLAAVANLEQRQIHVENLRASLPVQPSARQPGELTRAIAARGARGGLARKRCFESELPCSGPARRSREHNRRASISSA